jgi:RimJ/RimL family protein N-acetyltransferase
MYLNADLGYRRYEWRCNAPNEQSRWAALRLWFLFKSTFRQHMMQRGGIATPSSMRCSITNDPAQGELRETLVLENFDANGWQRVSPSSLS